MHLPCRLKVMLWLWELHISEKGYDLWLDKLTGEIKAFSAFLGIAFSQCVCCASSAASCCQYSCVHRADSWFLCPLLT